MSDAVSKRPTVQGSNSSYGGKKRPLESQDVSVPVSGASSNKKYLDSETWSQQRNIETQEAEAQMAAYALEMAASTRGTRLHTIGVFLRDDKVSYWYVGASGMVRTSPESTLSIIFDFEKVMAIHVALSYCGPEQLGAFPPHIICPPANEPFPDSFPPESLAGYTIDLADEHDQEKPYTVTLGKHMFNQHSLFGRRTTVYRAASTSVDTGGRVLVVKLSQQVRTRTSEVELIQHAHDRGAGKHLPEILKAKDLWYLSDGTRKHFVFDESQEWEDRVLRCILLPFYLPLRERLRENPDSIKTMVMQMLTCECICLLLLCNVY